MARFWLQERHGCLIDEELAVPVPYALSDIDLMAMRADMNPFELPDGTAVGPRLAVEVKAEHDWDATGRDFGRALAKDVSLMRTDGAIPAGTRGVKFVMLKEEHAQRATAYFGTVDFDRLFIVHALDPRARRELTPGLADHRIYWVTVGELVADICLWYRDHPRKAALRRTLAGDLLHLLFGPGGLECRPAQGYV